jgi:flagellar hook-length control protein FliK
MLLDADASPTGTVRPAVAQSAPVPIAGTVTVAPLPDIELLAGPDAEPVSTDPVAPPVGQAKPVRTDCVAVPDIQPEDVRENLALPAEPDAPVPAAVVPPRPDRQGPVPTRTGDATIAGKPAAPQQPVIAPAPTPAIFAAAAPSTTASPVVAKGTPTPAEPAPAEEHALAEAEEEPAVVATPMAMTPVVPMEVATPPAADPAAPPKSDHADADTPPHGAPAAAIAVPLTTPAPLSSAEATTSPDRPATVAAAGVRPVREEAVTADTKPAPAAAHPAPGAFAALVEPKPVAAAPAVSATPPAPVPEARVMAEPGRMGHEMAVAIARHTAEGGGEALTVRLNPAEFGRIDVTLSFDDRGTLRAVLAAETPAALDVLRRDSADLGRALSDAGMRTDAQSFRFDTRQGGADAGGQGAQGQQRWQPAATPRTLATATADLPEPEYRPLRTRGGVDLMA